LLPTQENLFFVSHAYVRAVSTFIDYEKFAAPVLNVRMLPRGTFAVNDDFTGLTTPERDRRMIMVKSYLLVSMA
jgi:hypothetical protein